MKPFENSYLVTGAAGFIGSRFVESCQPKTIPVISCDEQRLFTSRPQNQGLSFGKTVDRDQLLSWLRQELPSLKAIIHLGAITDTREMDLSLLKRFNLEFSQALWNYATEKQIPFIYASSAATYGDGAQGYDDDETKIPLLHPLNPYGDSKQQFDLWALEQERRGHHPPQWAGFKFFNVYGFGENHKNFMSSVVLHSFQQIQTEGRVTLFKSHKAGIADGQQKRDFVSVEDVVQVLHFAVQNPIPRGIFNLGTGQARSFLDLTRAVFASLNRPENIQYIDTPLSIRDKYQYFTEATTARLRGTGYIQPFLSLEEGIRRYISRLLSEMEPHP